MIIAVYNKRFLKIPLNLIYVNEASPTKLVSLFQMIEEGNKPIIGSSTGKSCQMPVLKRLREY